MMQMQDGFPAVTAADTEHRITTELFLQGVAPCFLFPPSPHLNITGEEQCTDAKRKHHCPCAWPL